MALIKFGSLITSGSGKLGGHTVQHSRGGFQLKTTGRPLHRPSASQLNIRSINHQIHSAWKSLTDNERKIWDQVAHPSLSGASLFYRYNYNYLSYGLPVVTDPYSYEKIVLGPELVPNPFFNSSSGWSLLSGYSVPNIGLSIAASSASFCYGSVSTAFNTNYLLSVHVDNCSAAGLVCYYGASLGVISFNTSGVFYSRFNRGSYMDYYIYFENFVPVTAFISKVSLREIL
jgi:hypothetical protein